jgi:hypothetical protein
MTIDELRANPQWARWTEVARAAHFCGAPLVDMGREDLLAVIGQIASELHALRSENDNRLEFLTGTKERRYLRIWP